MESIRSEQHLYQRGAHFATTMVEFLTKMQEFPVALQREQIQMLVQEAADGAQQSLALHQHASASFDVQMVHWQINLLNNIAQQFHAIALDHQQKIAVQIRVPVVQHSPVPHIQRGGPRGPYRMAIVGNDEECGMICKAKKAASSAAEAAAQKAKEVAKKLQEAAVAALKPIIEKELGPLQTLITTMGKEEFQKWSQGLAKDLGIVLPNTVSDTNALIGALITNIPAVSARVASPTFVPDTKAILKKHLQLAAATAKRVAVKHAETRVQSFITTHPEKMASAVDLGKAFGVNISATTKPADAAKQIKDGLERFAQDPVTDPVQIVARLMALQKFLAASN